MIKFISGTRITYGRDGEDWLEKTYHNKAQIPTGSIGHKIYNGKQMQFGRNHPRISKNVKDRM
jgi:hypothetical protein